jgi:hypothetical protein
LRENINVGKKERGKTMNETIIVKTLEGIEWNGTNILFGYTKEDVEKILGKPDKKKESYYYFDSALRFDFDENGELEFIEFLGGIESSVHPVIYGTDAFTAMADEIYDLLKKNNGGRLIDEECGYAYAFVNISVGVYRESIPEDIEEMEEEGAFPEDLEEEKKLAYHWATLGIGKKGYYL